MGVLVDDGVVDPQRIGASGGSYGDGVVVAGRAQRPDDAPRPDAVPWRSPHGTPLHPGASTLAALATTSSTRSSRTGARWTTLPGRRTSGPRRRTVGVQKAAVMDGFFLARSRRNPGAQMLALGTAAEPPWPYDALRPVWSGARDPRRVQTSPTWEAPRRCPCRRGTPTLRRRGGSSSSSTRILTPTTRDAGGDVLRGPWARAQPRQGGRRRRARRVAGRLDAPYVWQDGPPRRRACGRGITVLDRTVNGPWSFADWSEIGVGGGPLTTRAAQTVAASGGLYGHPLSARTAAPAPRAGRRTTADGEK